MIRCAFYTVETEKQEPEQEPREHSRQEQVQGSW